MSSFPLTFIFFKMVIAPPTNTGRVWAYKRHSHCMMLKTREFDPPKMRDSVVIERIFLSDIRYG